MNIVVLALTIIVVVTFLALPSLPVRSGVARLVVATAFTALVAVMIWRWAKWQYPSGDVLQTAVGVGVTSILVLFVSYGLAGDNGKVPRRPTSGRRPVA